MNGSSNSTSGWRAKPLPRDLPGGRSRLAVSGPVRRIRLWGVQDPRLTEADCFCFPTYYYAESFGLVLVEAMAFGLPLITTRWRSIPELLPEDYPGFVEIDSPVQVANKLRSFPTLDLAASLRRRFVDHFTFERHLAGLAAAFRTLEDTELEPEPPSSRLCESRAR